VLLVPGATEPKVMVQESTVEQQVMVQGTIVNNTEQQTDEQAAADVSQLQPGDMLNMTNVAPGLRKFYFARLPPPYPPLGLI